LPGLRTPLKPPPADEQNPLAGDVSLGDLILLLVDK
jgi:hypothetical protein